MVIGQAPLENVLNTGLFDFGKAEQSLGFLKELGGEHVPETEESGISSVACRQELVFIGQNVEADRVRRELDVCLLSDDELAGGPEIWRTYEDQFPAWFQDEAGA